MKDNKDCTYTKWYTYYKQEDNARPFTFYAGKWWPEKTFVVYKTRYKRPNWWPKNINSPGYEETIKLATISAAIQLRFVVSFFVAGYYISGIEWNKDANISFMDRLRVLKSEHSISEYELQRFIA